MGILSGLTLQNNCLLGGIGSASGYHCLRGLLHGGNRCDNYLARNRGQPRQPLRSVPITINQISPLRYRHGAGMPIGTQRHAASNGVGPSSSKLRSGSAQQWRHFWISGNQSNQVFHDRLSLEHHATDVRNRTRVHGRKGSRADQAQTRAGTQAKEETIA